MTAPTNPQQPEPSINYMRVVEGSETCLNGHPITIKTQDNTPWMCGDINCDYYDGISVGQQPEPYDAEKKRQLRPAAEDAFAEIRPILEAQQPQYPGPPEGCICASFWTVRQAHKPACPLAGQQPGPRLLKAVNSALTTLRTKQIDALTPSQDERALAEFTEEMRQLFTPIKITPVGQQPEDDELNNILADFGHDYHEGIQQTEAIARVLEADAKARIRFTTWADRRADKRVEEAENKALKYAHQFVDLFKDWPDQVEYVLRHLDADVYRKKHKGVKISLRATHHPKGGSNGK